MKQQTSWKRKRGLQIGWLQTEKCSHSMKCFSTLSDFWNACLKHIWEHPFCLRIWLHTTERTFWVFLLRKHCQQRRLIPEKKLWRACIPDCYVCLCQWVHCVFIPTENQNSCNCQQQASICVVDFWFLSFILCFSLLAFSSFALVHSLYNVGLSLPVHLYCGSRREEMSVNVYRVRVW